MKQKVLAVVGPTASGKTSLAITMAEEFNGEVISADSRQVYKGLDEGTAKVTQAEMQGVPHHLISICDIDTTYTATDFARDAAEAIEDISARGKLPIIAGGTFFYLDQLRGGFAAAPVAPNPTLRNELETLSTEALLLELESKDPRRAADIDPHNRRRLIRSLEIVAALGAVPPPTKSDSLYDFLIIGLERGKEELRSRFAVRAKEWLRGPFETEVRHLLDSGVSRERLHEIGFEYQLMLEYIDGTLTDDAFIQKCIEKNWQYAKRQMTWLKKDLAIQWIEATKFDITPNILQKFLK